jgi:anti-anti-sigma regulatory factor
MAAPAQIGLRGRLTIATIQETRATLLGALQAGAPVELDCTEGSDFDICFVQLLQSARILAARDGIALTLRQPLPPRLAGIMAEGGFQPWATA